MTETEIVNLAISKLGGTLIARLGDATIPGSKQGELLYRPTLERILRDFPWSFAQREESLAQRPAPETQHWTYTYQLPPYFIRMLVLLGENRVSNINLFSRTGDKLHCNETPAIIQYVTSDLTPDDFDPDFRDAFVTLLASELATPLLQSPELAKKFMEEYLVVALPKAKSVDARETDSGENYGPYNAIARSPLVQSRRRGRGDSYGIFEIV